MAKRKSRKKSKSKKGKKSVRKATKSNVPSPPKIDPELMKELTKDLKDVFVFKNGDVYMGHFTITGSGEIVREGRGKYFSGDGTVMSGRWEDNVLVEAERITYPDGGWYRGALTPLGAWYTGLGSYGWPTLPELRGDFQEARPYGSVTLTDIDDNTWQGHAVHGSLTLVPRNHFFDSEDVPQPSANVEPPRESLGASKLNVLQSTKSQLILNK